MMRRRRLLFFFCVVCVDGDIEPRDDDVRDVYVYVRGYHVRTNEKRRRERNAFSTPRRCAEYDHG